MQYKTIRQERIRKVSQAFAIALSSLLLIACGNEPEQNQDPNSLQPFNPQQTVVGGAPGVPPQPSSGVLGNYGGTLSMYQFTVDGRRVETQQFFTLTLSTQALQGADPQVQYAYMNFTSSGTRQVTGAAYMSTLSNGMPNGTSLTYRFRSQPTQLAGLSSSSVVVEMEVSLQNGMFNPVQSWIRILDCRLSQTTSCSGLFTSAALSGLRKL
jgi:hypothetical protein